MLVAQEVAAQGYLELWRFQGVENHQSPFETDPQGALEGEPAMVKEWIEILTTRFPGKRFVIETLPFCEMTWYQASGMAPVDDEDDYEIYMVPITINSAEVINHSTESIEAQAESLNDEIAEALRQLHDNPCRVGDKGPCEYCGKTEGFTEPVVSTVNRGVRVMTCKACSRIVAHSYRTIRDKVGF